MRLREQPDKGIQRTFATGGHVLKDIDLDIERGSAVCVTGASGSGKTTLLRLLAGVLPPTTGRIEIAGTTSALIDVGDNVDLTLSGIRNIERQLRYRRLPKSEHEVYAREVIAFGGLEGFEELPVERYSSGMRLRLSFALAFKGDADILLIDDVIGVGDLEFRERCFAAIGEYRDGGGTLVMVTHDQAVMQEFGSRTITLADGAISSDTGIHEPALARHEAGAVGGVRWAVSDLLPENDAIALCDVAVAKNGDTIRIQFRCRTKIQPQRFRPMVDVFRGRRYIFRSLYPEYLEGAERTDWTLALELPLEYLPGGKYYIDINVVSLRNQEIYSLKARSIVTMTLEREGGANDAADPVIVPTFDWAVEPFDQNDGEAAA